MKNSFQRLIDDLRGKKTLKIYPPHYDEHRIMESSAPEIFNRFGKKLDLFFIRDRHLTQSNIYGDGSYFLWDRFNYSLETHFYTGNATQEQMGKPRRKYAWLIEPRIKQPKDYAVFEKTKLAKDFDAILTADARLLEKLPNAIFFPTCATAWAAPDENADQKKLKMISILSSHKKMCPLHYLRIKLAKEVKRRGLADAYGTFDGGARVSYEDVLSDYRYHIAIENEVSPYFFTERLISSFLKMTVPIYLGASEVHHFFNPDGMIIITPKQAENIKDVLRICSEKDYATRLPAIKENFKRAMLYTKSRCDLIYERLFLSDKATKFSTDLGF